MSIDIAPVREEHIEGFHAALDAVSRERDYLAFLEAPPIEEVRAFVARNIARGYPQLVALDEGRVVGWCDVLPMDRPIMRHCGVLAMGLLPAYRGRGIGEQLMRQALSAARELGLSRIELSVRADNTRAARLYAKLGFAVEGRKRRAFLVDGVHHDLVVMGLLFDAEA
jgi:ribosomal protein S18 acetylase RimI-like enzyme